jgi:hypothetical protein
MRILTCATTSRCLAPVVSSGGECPPQRSLAASRLVTDALAPVLIRCYTDVVFEVGRLLRHPEAPVRLTLLATPTGPVRSLPWDDPPRARAAVRARGDRHLPTCLEQPASGRDGESCLCFDKRVILPARWTVVERRAAHRLVRRRNGARPLLGRLGNDDGGASSRELTPPSDARRPAPRARASGRDARGDVDVDPRTAPDG